LALLILSSSLLALTIVSTTREWRSRLGVGGGPDANLTLDARRQRALRQLDDLLAEGLHREGRLLEFYTRTSGIVRTYVEAMDGTWAPSLTSGELMRRLRARSGAEAASGLPGEMGMAEVVKFGRLRPEPSIAESHWRVLRGWVERSGAPEW
jgi:hypothetical protein